MANIRKNTVKKLASSSLKSNKSKYTVMTASVILTTVLFSSLFTIVGSLVSEFAKSYMGECSYIDPAALIVCGIAVVIFMISG